MAKHLLIVESPAKAKTIKKYLGKDFNVLASYGHVRDIIPKEGAVDPNNNFAMKYAAIEKNEKHVNAIMKALAKADDLLLATDPDREGEAISWHLLQLVLEDKKLKTKPVKRVVFNQITKSAIKEAVGNPRDISEELVDAYKARRALDFLVGFNLSPLLWRKVRPGLSAGRVQSPALRMICERELEIEAFKSQEYWSIISTCGEKKKSIESKLIQYKGDKLKQFDINNKKDADKTTKALEKAADGKLIVGKVEEKTRKRNPAPPFITSTLQQEAARKLGFTANRTMRTAQQLYEGVELGDEGAIGLITYMRTDSVTLAEEAIVEIRDYIAKTYGDENIPDEPNRYKTKSKNAQEAHEAIRPTSMLNEPNAIKSALSTDQFKLYSLIWKRAVASQMIHATIKTVSVDLLCGKDNIFRATGSTIAVPGFIKIYQEGIDDAKQAIDDKILPPLKEGDELKLLEIKANQHFTEPPPRYTEASLIKTLEEHGIGRPSTYASIISTLKYRKYVDLDSKRFIPTDVGRIVSKFLSDYFTKYVDYKFTAGLEDELDEISRGEKQWVPMLEIFWKSFKENIDKISETVSRKDVTHEEIDEKCPDCGNPLSIRLGRHGRFIGCTTYPECKYTRNLVESKEEQEAAEVLEDRKCPKCEADLIIKRGRYGKFIGCSGYPDCKHMEPLVKPKNTEVKCPECKKGDMLERRSRHGKIFFSCEHYPKCKYATWNEPVAKPCPTCDWPILTLKTTKRRGTEEVCPQKECKYVEQIAPPEDK